MFIFEGVKLEPTPPPPPVMYPFSVPALIDSTDVGCGKYLAFPCRLRERYPFVQRTTVDYNGCIK